MGTTFAVQLLRPRKPEICPGYTFRRESDNGLRECATVVSLRNDPVGIPHVCFSVTLERVSSDRVEKAMRMLSLSSFIEVYSERVA